MLWYALTSPVSPLIFITLGNLKFKGMYYGSYLILLTIFALDIPFFHCINCWHSEKLVRGYTKSTERLPRQVLGKKLEAGDKDRDEDGLIISLGSL